MSGWPTRPLPYAARRSVIAGTLGAAALALIGCTRDPSEGTAALAANASAAPRLPSEHVHGVGRDTADGLVYLATHSGLYRYDRPNDPTSVGPVIDLMGFTIHGPGHFYASGHPAAGVKLPEPAGLIESRDAGQTWKVLSRGGQSDFHALSARNGVLAAFDGTLRISQDGTTWLTATIDAAPRDLALSPDGATLVATTEKGPLVSTDLARSWQPITGAPMLLLAAWANATTVVGATPTGQVTLSRDRGRSWTNVGTAVGQPQALSATATGKELEVLVVTDRAILASAGGAFTTPA